MALTILSYEVTEDTDVPALLEEMRTTKRPHIMCLRGLLDPLPLHGYTLVQEDWPGESYPRAAQGAVGALIAIVAGIVLAVGNVAAAFFGFWFLVVALLAVYYRALSNKPMFLTYLRNDTFPEPLQHRVARFEKGGGFQEVLIGERRMLLLQVDLRRDVDAFVVYDAIRHHIHGTPVVACGSFGDDTQRIIISNAIDFSNTPRLFHPRFPIYVSRDFHALKVEEHKQFVIGVFGPPLEDVRRQEEREK